MRDIRRDKDPYKVKVEEQRWESANIHPAEVHIETLTLPEEEIRHPPLHANDLHQWLHQRLLVPGRLHSDYLHRIQHQELQGSLHPSNQRRYPEELS